MRRAAATNATREQRRRAGEARRPKPAAGTSATEGASIPDSASDSAEPDAAEPAPDAALSPSETDPRPLWQQVRDYTPPTPLERALSSMSKLGETSANASDAPAGSSPANGAPHAATGGTTGDTTGEEDHTSTGDAAYHGAANPPAAVDHTEAPPMPKAADRPAARRMGRQTLAESLADVVTEHEDTQAGTSPHGTPELAHAADADDVTGAHETAADQVRREASATSEALPTQPLSDEERIAAAKLEAQRVRRIKRRQQQRRQRRVSVLGGIVRTFLVVVPSALLMATILSWWTDPQFLRPEMRHNIQSAIIAEGATPVPPTPFPTPNWARLIGIVSGHSGPGRTVGYDPGAVCDDLESLNEHDINMQTSILVVRKLRERGYVVDLLDEFDPRLISYEAAALVSIHSNTCQDFGEEVSGFLVAKAQARPEGGADTDLAECVAKYYNRITQLDRRFGLTEDMTDYHTFREIDVDTPAAIIELGFMRADRDILNEQPELLAEGIVQGIMCFLEPELDTLPDPTMTPTP